jgi:hypothetical protein
MNSKSQYKPKAKKPKNVASLKKQRQALSILDQQRLAIRDAVNSSIPYLRRPSDSKAQQAPAASSKLMVSSKPIIRADNDSKRVIHRELLGSISGTTAFTVSQSVALNPGLNTSFPWLSMEALGWETYRFNSLRFEYVTRTGTSVPGSVILTTDYDASDPAPVSEQIAANYAGACEDAPWKDISQELRPSALHGLGPRKFLRYGVLSPNEDIKTYDSGNFFLCTLDGTAVPWGKLWVVYDVSFFTPQMVSTTLLSGAYQIEGTSPTTADPFDAVDGSVKSGGPINISISGGVITFLVPGQYVIDYNATATTIAGFSIGGSAGAVVAYEKNENSGTLLVEHSIWSVTAPGATVTVAVTITAGTESHLLVAALPTSPVF